MKGLPFLLILVSVKLMMIAVGVTGEWKTPWVPDCKCPQSVYNITTRRAFCGHELELYNPNYPKYHQQFCGSDRAFLCPQDGPGQATLLPLPQNSIWDYCYLACQPPPNQGNVNECSIRFISDKSKAENSVKKLYPGGKLPKSHLPKKN
jgi:hypothetical protein